MTTLAIDLLYSPSLLPFIGLTSVLTYVALLVVVPAVPLGKSQKD
jgi:hypothetical protein